MTPPTRPATPWVRLDAHSGTIGVVVELDVALEVFFVFDAEPPIFKLI
jgi:hypothetical protein